MNNTNIDQIEAALYVSKQIELLNTTGGYDRKESSEYDFQPSAFKLKEYDETTNEKSISDVESSKVLISEQQSESTMSTLAATTVVESEDLPIETLSDLGSTTLSIQNSESQTFSVKKEKAQIASNQNSLKNIFQNNRRSKKHHGVVICGHRGGFKSTRSPENTIMAFEKAIQTGLQAVELDIWMTYDKRLVIIHGGDDGEMPAFKDQDKTDPAYQPKYIFEMTFDDINEHFKKTEYWIDSPQNSKCLVPELKQLFELVNLESSDPSQDKKIMMNLELKNPQSDVKSRYKMDECIKILHSQIQETGLSTFCMVQSFDHTVVKEVERINAEYCKTIEESEWAQAYVATLYLHNYYWTDERPSTEIMCGNQGTGGHLQINEVTPELVQEMHKHNKIVAVWVDLITPADIYEENREFYHKIYDLGIDMLTTDNCDIAQEELKAYHESKN